jgi:hypothetical protein
MFQKQTLAPETPRARVPGYGPARESGLFQNPAGFLEAHHFYFHNNKK